MSNAFRPIINKLLTIYVHWERWLLGAFVVLFVISAFVLTRRFRNDSTILVPANGGTYIEGSVGQMQPLNPWFTMTNDVNRDIVSLIFSGLLKYNPETKRIEDDLAHLEISRDGKIYTVELKENLFWHDSTEENPHPVTSDDVVFTFQTVQNPEFPNSLLRQNFQGITIAKINERTTQFRLSEPYSFFSSNLTLGLLPKRSFENVPMRLLDQTIDFGLQPVGAGPYRLKTIVETELSTEVTIERFDRTIPPVYHLDRIIFRIFPDYRSLLSDLRNLDGIRLVPKTEDGSPVAPKRFTMQQYTLPQYVAIFYNMNRSIFRDRNLRLGLQLGTNKQEVAESAGETMIVDTPLLEIDTSDWQYQFDPNAAQGALFESDWYFPEKIRLQRLLEQREANATGVLKMDAIVYLETGAVLSISGTSNGLSGRNTVNGVPLQEHPTESGSWIVALPTHGGTGSVKLGLNLIRLLDERNRTLDSYYVLRTSNAVDYQRASSEQKLVDQYLKSKSNELPEQERIDITDLTLDRGYLRRRRNDDPVGVRINDKGERLTLNLLTSPSPASYGKVAETLKKQWAALGIDLVVDIPESRNVFEERVLKREYDILLFGQSLLDNLDSYPYWHSSGVQKLTGNRNDLRLDAYNLSQYASFEADALLERIRTTSNELERDDALLKLQDVLKRDIPAVFLYSPQYAFAYRQDILGVEPGKLSLHSDRFLTLHGWYVKQERIFQAGKNWISFFGWLSRLFSQEQATESVTDDGTGSTLP